MRVFRQVDFRSLENSLRKASNFIVEKSLAVVEAFIAPPPGQNAMYLSFTDRLEDAGVENAEDYADRALRIIAADIIGPPSTA